MHEIWHIYKHSHVTTVSEKWFAIHQIPFLCSNYCFYFISSLFSFRYFLLYACPIWTCFKEVFFIRGTHSLQLNVCGARLPHVFRVLLCVLNHTEQFIHSFIHSFNKTENISSFPKSSGINIRTDKGWVLKKD